MRIAIITGASSGMGRRFAETCDRRGPFDEVWVIARRENRLEELKKTVPYPVRPIAVDLTDRTALLKIRELLETEKPDVGLLVNAGGFGRFEAFTDTPAEVNVNMVDLNCSALMTLTSVHEPGRRGGQYRVSRCVPAYPVHKYLRGYQSICPIFQPRT